MVVVTPTPIRSEKIREIELPIIDLSVERSEVSRLIVKACAEFGFFKVINHGVPQDVITRMEEESLGFFAKPAPEKQRAGPANPFGYGSKNIGFNGDIGEVEYLLLSTNLLSISQQSRSISNDPTKFSSAVSGYVQSVGRLACEILDLMAEGLWVADTSVFSGLIRDVDNDSVLRLNRYPPLLKDSLKDRDTSPSSFHHHQPQHLHYLHHHHHHHHEGKGKGNNTSSTGRVGFGEHSDPQILTILRSNDVGGLQISPEDGVWVPVPPDPSAFCVNVGDVLQAMTNGRFVSVRHRALANSCQSRMSMAYFGAPPLKARIAAVPELITKCGRSLYRPFTWAEYKKATYSLRLGESRLNLFRDDENVA